ncbi:hypothetical protein LFM56_03815 [Cellulomonas iranensis]|uniref:hypothetical protein n=1 Tax=Cellulomonas iranensis TaxID=76862 RepID=UPI001CF1F87B|nr:hypothetical protein [Cellulomonas iranensis]UCN15464.1 hypothetical protein LFM56_03815 [Cellulomonas iranensis]
MTHTATAPPPRRTTVPLASVGRRARTQVGLLAALLAVVVAGAVLLGTCALVLTTGQEQAVDAALRRTDPHDLAVEVTFRLEGADPRAVDDAARVLGAALAPARPAVTPWRTSAVRPLAVASAPGARAYVTASDDLTAHAALTSGRWPTTTGADVVEVAVPDVAARALGLAVGDEAVLGELRDGRRRDPVPGSGDVPLVVVGTLAPEPGAEAWDRDPLRGTASSAAGSGGDASTTAAGTGATTSGTDAADAADPAAPVTYGPLLAAPDALAASAVEVDRVSLVARPDVAGLRPADRADLRRGVDALPAGLDRALGDPVAGVRVLTGLGGALAAAQTQERVTRSVVVVVALVGAALAAAALALAGRLVGVRRAAETRLLVARGAARSQLVARAAVESAALGVVAVAAAVPLTVALYRGLTRLPLLADAGLASDVGPTRALVLTVVLGVLVLVAVLVAPALRAADDRPVHVGVRGRVARAAVDALLVGLAAVGVLQLRGRAFAAGGGADPLLVAVPVLCLVAGAAVALRVVPWVARRAEVRAARSPGVVVPLASWEVARRGHSAGAALLLVLATAAATFGTSLGATWATSAQDQADTAVGADVAVARTAAAPLAQAAALSDLTGAAAVPLTDREVALGPVAGPGPATPATRLAAIDTRHDAGLVRGRLPAGTTWPGLTAGLAPGAPVAGVALPAGVGTLDVGVTGVVETLRGRAIEDLTVTPTLVVEGPDGARQAVPGAPVPLDGAAHAQTLPLPATAGLTVVAVDLQVVVEQRADALALPTEALPLDVEVTLTPPDGGTAQAPAGGGWSGAVAADSVDRLRTPDDVTVRQDGGAVTVAGRVGLVPAGLLGGPAHLVLTGFPPPDDVPVLLGRDLAASIAAEPGDTYALGLGGTTVVARVVGVVPPRAALPRGATLLADHDALSRAVVAHGPLADVVDAWWLAGAPDAAAARVDAAGLGAAVTRTGLAAHLRDDPLRIGVQLALWLLVAAAVVLAVTGTLVQTAAALDARAVDVARLQGMGLSRRAVVGTLLVEHGVVSGLVVAAGVAVGALTSFVVGPHLVVSATGEVPVPAPVAVWPWAAQGAVVAVLLVACTAVVVPVTTRLARRATVAHLRMEGGR